jgi:hypothetical protein
MNQDYIPPALGKRKTWYQLEISTADAFYAGIGMSALEISDYKAHCLNQIGKIDAIATAKANLKSAVSDQRTTGKVDDAAIRTQVRSMKTDAGYTPAKGEAIQVIGTHEIVDYPHYVPEIGGEAFPGYIRIIGMMNGLEQLNIYRRLKGAVTWGNPIASITHPKFDDHSLPAGAAVYEYMIIGVMDDHEITKESLVQPVTYGG